MNLTFILVALLYRQDITPHDLNATGQEWVIRGARTQVEACEKVRQLGTKRCSSTECVFLAHKVEVTRISVREGKVETKEIELVCEGAHD